jgi:hypothetical protein
MSPQSSGAGARSPGGDSGASRSARCWRTNPRRGARRRPATTYGQLHRVAARLPRRRGDAVGYTGDDGDAGQARDGELARTALTALGSSSRLPLDAWMCVWWGSAVRAFAILLLVHAAVVVARRVGLSNGAATICPQSSGVLLLVNVCAGRCAQKNKKRICVCRLGMQTSSL